ncbi:succinyldiaminopimelate transaminase [Sanguibacter suaedae]|uniref:Aminotransferase n=1 Tax=Sanguibacter suaedae TaxID=2795737 RepID=A0A934I8Q5_9MICO|nr:succinyldiaminopimelate transaminase [Sanguibacter suaedae]MBI9115187.1 succinyldiaminopimelate transaminase [Sanguibacter suaedae]
MGFEDLGGLAFPWDTLRAHAARAREHADGVVDLSVGTPVDPTPAVAREALARAADAPGYPTTHGTDELREAVVRWFARRRSVPDLDPAAVLPTIGSKELVGLLPSLLGLRAGDRVVHPAVAYPTYDVGARLAGASPWATDDVDDWRGRPGVRLVWVNSPGNPTGRVLGIEELARVVEAAREIGAVVVSDECYAELPWEEPWVTSGVPSVLDPRVNGGSTDGVLAAYSLSKQSNLAGYRAAFVAGDRRLVDRLLQVRKHLGMIVPAPVQAAMTAVLGDDDHVRVQREVYGRRRTALREALGGAGLVVDGSEAGLYLWARPEGSGSEGLGVVPGGSEAGEAPCWGTLAALAERGILVAPGSFYGPAAGAHVRVATTAPDDRVEAAVSRLARV